MSAAAVSRAGATTLAELACAGCPAVLIPYPNAIGDHQVFNARAFESAGAARVVVQNTEPALTAADLKMTLQPLLDDSACREEMRLHMKSLARPNAASDVADALLAQMSQEQIAMRQSTQRHSLPI
jgi:UDP-N-acetylglucosamine--N-acetylmuramyl-(pentapeptide) pyrophosphoryl-undecaprenol N-acetylglucosamine transferase